MCVKRTGQNVWPKEQERLEAAEVHSACAASSYTRWKNC